MNDQPINNLPLSSSEKLDILTKFLPVAVYTTNEDGILNYFNDHAVKLWGRKPKLNDPKETKFCGSWKMFDAKGYKLPHNQSPMARALKEGIAIRDEEIVIISPDYSRLNILVHIDPIFNKENKIIGGHGVLFEITDRQKIEKDVHHLAAIVESSDDAIVSKTLSGEITSWNNGARNIFGFTSDEVIGKNITLFIPTERIDEEIVIINKIRKGEKVEHFETVRLTKEGKRINVSITVSPIKNSKGEIIGASKIARDITEHIETRKKLKKFNDELRMLNRHKDDFISMASHELKTPLTVLKAHLELLDMNTSEEDKPFINKTLIHVEKITYLINEMLDVSQLNANKMKLDLFPFNMEELVQECVDSAKVVNQNGNITYTSNPTETIVVGDRNRLEQVIINLLNNAVKYSPDKPEIKVTLINRSGEIELQVEDKGIGIPVNKINNIFNRFYRMEGLSKHIAGLGIGLYISRKIIEKHHGRIWVEKSEPGKGSTFCFVIPLEPPVPSKASSAVKKSV